MLKNYKYLAAVSGGPDSMALLTKYHNKISGVCHVNYHYRDTSDYDQSIVEKYCQQYRIKFYLLNIDKKVYKTKQVKNFENWARIKRYEFFLSIAKKTNVNQMLTGHNADDFIESYYMQKQKNSQLLFYGIKKQNYYHDLKIVRPFIKIRKATLENYCKKHHIKYAIDITNTDSKFLRNKIRKQVSQLNNKEFYKIYRQVNKINKSKQKFSLKAVEFYKKWEKFNFDLIFFKKLNWSIQVQLVYQLLINISPNRISSNKINEIINFLISKKGNIYYRVNQNLKIYKKQNKIQFINTLDLGNN